MHNHANGHLDWCLLGQQSYELSNHCKVLERQRLIVHAKFSLLWCGRLYFDILITVHVKHLHMNYDNFCFMFQSHPRSLKQVYSSARLMNRLYHVCLWGLNTQTNKLMGKSWTLWTNMVSVCYLFVKEVNMHINLIYFGHNFDHPWINAITFVPNKQSKKPQFFSTETYFSQKSLPYVAAIRFVLTFYSK